MPYFEDLDAALRAKRNNRGLNLSPVRGAVDSFIESDIKFFRRQEREQPEQGLLVGKLQQLAEAERLYEVERLQGRFAVSGDFAGCVNGEWQGLADTGAGIVRYNDKEYKTENIGFVSNACGERVQLCFAQGKYFASY